MEFESFNKLARLSRNCVITEKLDGTNAQIAITEYGDFFVGSRNRWITPDNDNYSFARWAYAHKDELMALGPGRHFGEWWGYGIQRGYQLKEKRFSLFNVGRWTADNIPYCCSVVPVLYEGLFTEQAVNDVLELLRSNGSIAAPGYNDPEGIVIYHQAAGVSFKKTLKGDDSPKSLGKT